MTVWHARKVCANLVAVAMLHTQSLHVLVNCCWQVVTEFHEEHDRSCMFLYTISHM